MLSRAEIDKKGRTDIVCVGLIVITIAAFHYKILLGSAVFPFDYEGYHYPLLRFIWNEMANGRFPLYDPYVYAGMPFYLNTQAGLFYPMHLLFLGILACFKIEASQYLINFIGIFHFALGGAFFHYLARHYGIRPLLSATGAILYALNGHVIAQSQHLGVIETYAWLPLVFLLLSRFFRKPDLGLAAWLGVAVAQLILIGFLPQVVSMLLVGCVFSVTLLFLYSIDWKRKLAGLSFAAGITICLSAVVIIPLLTVDQPMEKLAVHGPVPMSFVKTLIWPNIFRTFHWPDYTGPGDPTVSYLYAGSIIPALAVLGLFVARKKVPEFVIAFVFSALFVFFPVVDLLGLHSVSPFFALIRPENFLYFPVLFGILSALLTVEYLSSKRRLLVLIIVLQAAITFVPLTNSPQSTIDARSICAMGMTAPLLIILIFRSAAAGMIGLLMAAQLFVMNMNRDLWTMPTRPDAVTPRTIDFKNEDLLLVLKKSVEPFRVAIDNEHMGGAWNGSWRIWRLESINGFEPSRSQKFFETVVRELSDWHTNRLFNIARLESPLLNILNVKYYVASSAPPPNRLPSQWRQAYQGYWNVYENQNFHERYAVLPLEAVNIDQEGTAAAYLPGSARDGSVDIIARTPGSARLSVRVDHPKAFFFISERNYRGWEIVLDGKRVKPLSVNELMMGFPILRGHHTVILKFGLPYQIVIIAMTMLGMGIIAAGFTAGKKPRMLEFEL